MSNLKDYLSRLQEQDEEDIIYSKPQENTTHIIPPEDKPSKPKLNLSLKKKSEEEVLFEKSRTPISKKEIWIQYYKKALVSRKQNSYVTTMREGRFTINEKDEVLLLPKLEVVDKSSNEILSMSWLNSESKLD